MSYYLHNIFPDLYSYEPVYDTLVLSGGAINGIILLGSVSYLYEQNKLADINNYIGTSVGGIICYLLNIGYTPLEIISHINITDWLNHLQKININKALNGEGVIDFMYIQDILERLTLNKIHKYFTLKELFNKTKKQLILTTFNMSTSTTEYLSHLTNPDLPCITALRMTSNIPIIFDRFKYNKQFYIDGGITDNFPILKSMLIGKNILGIYLNDKIVDEPEKGIMKYIFNILNISFSQHSKYQIDFVKNNDNIKLYEINCHYLNSLSFHLGVNELIDLFTDGYKQMENL